MTSANDLRVMISSLDADDSGVITREEWLKMATRPEVLTYFEVADLDIKDANEFFDAVVNLTGCEEIEIEHFVEGCMKVKGAASSIDLQVLLFQVREIKHMVDDITSRSKL